jgi:hypothetical protein
VIGPGDGPAAAFKVSVADPWTRAPVTPDAGVMVVLPTTNPAPEVTTTVVVIFPGPNVEPGVGWLR